MLQITDAAASYLEQALSNATELEEPRIRVRIEDGSVKMTFDEERAGDTTVKHDGDTLIVMDTATSDRLHDRKLDFDDQYSNLVLK